MANDDYDHHWWDGMVWYGMADLTKLLILNKEKTEHNTHRNEKQKLWWHWFDQQNVIVIDNNEKKI